MAEVIEPDPGSLLSRARAHARRRVDALSTDALVVPFGPEVPVAVRYHAAITYEEYLEIKDAAGSHILTAYLDLIVRCCKDVVLRGETGWVSLQDETGHPSPLTIGATETLELLEVKPAEVLTRHYPYVEPGTARHNTLAVFATYGAGRIVGTDVDLHAQRLDAWLAGVSREVDTDLPPA